MKILIDMNLGPRWVGFFAEEGSKSIHWSAIGAANAPDSQLMDYAALHNLIIFTHDLDFGALLASRKARGPSVIQIRARTFCPKLRAELSFAQCAPTMTQLEAGALVTIDPRRDRIRLLPI